MRGKGEGVSIPRHHCAPVGGGSRAGRPRQVRVVHHFITPGSSPKLAQANLDQTGGTRRLKPSNTTISTTTSSTTAYLIRREGPSDLIQNVIPEPELVIVAYEELRRTRVRETTSA